MSPKRSSKFGNPRERKKNAVFPKLRVVSTRFREGKKTHTENENTRYNEINMCANGACNNHGLKPFGTLPNMISNTVAVHDDDDVDDDVDEDDVEDVSEKQRKRKPATKIANQRRKIRRSPVRTTCCFVNADGYSCHKGKADVQATHRVPESEKNKFSENAKCCNTCYRHFKYSNVTCCFVNADGYSCHKGKADVQATYRVPESEKNKFSENDRCCDACYQHFKCSNVTCCFVNADGYSCHKGKADVQARFRVPESEKNKFSENDRCCKSCYNRLQDAHFFRLKRVCVNCRLLGYERANTPGAWKLWQVGNDRFLLCSKCYDKSQAQRKRRKNGVPERRKGREAKGDW